jgi:hypothetical protein
LIEEDDRLAVDVRENELLFEERRHVRPRVGERRQREDEDLEIGLADGGGRTRDADLLDSVSRRAQAGRVREDRLDAVEVERDRDNVARRTRHGRHDRDVPLREHVEQRGLVVGIARHQK